MTSTIAWLDTSADEQRRVRELIALFAQPGTLDELGLGQIRDVMSNALFPGTSVLLTRARYFVLVPWAFLSTRTPGRSAAESRAHADQSQRILIATLQGSGQRGVIGAYAGAQVKTLPSTIYWNGLLTFGILRRDVAPEGLFAVRPEGDEADELSSRLRGDWYPTPPVPEGFPHTLDGGLDLTADEAVWLRERILDSVPGTLLAHLVAADHAPDTSSQYPWQDAACASASETAGDVLRHAHLFSLALQGATRLYGVLVAEAYEEAGFNAVVAPVERQREAYLAWVQSVEDEWHLLESWDLGAFWSFVRRQNEHVAPLTQRFVQAWVEGVLDGTAARALDDGVAARHLVAERERSVKRGQARLSNQKLLGLWGGGAGGGLNFRWPTVKTIVNDIQEGLSRA